MVILVQHNFGIIPSAEHNFEHNTLISRVTSESIILNFSSLIRQTLLKAGVHVKAVLMSLNTAFLPISRSRVTTLNCYAYVINRCCAVFCEFLDIFGKIIFFSKDRLN